MLEKYKKCLYLGMALFLLIPLSLNCSKKSDPDVTYGSDADGSDRATGSGNYGGEDLGDGSSAGLRTIYFAYDSATLNTDSKNILRKNAKFLKKNKNTSLGIEGHCDDRGTTEYNLALGERRANSVRSYMVNLGVKGKRLRSISYGEERPAMQGQSERVWAKNRRVEFNKN